jgi:hypothetical protein
LRGGLGVAVLLRLLGDRVVKPCCRKPGSTKTRMSPSNWLNANKKI